MRTKSYYYLSAVFTFAFLIFSACANLPASSNLRSSEREIESSPISGEREVVLDGAALRNKPNIEAELIGTLNRGDFLQLHAVSQDNLWYLVETNRYTSTGWILGEFIDTVTPRAVVNTQRLNVRTGPGSTYEPIYVVAQNDELVILGQVNECSWFKVSVGDGVVGWVSGKYVTINILCSSVTPVPILITPTVMQTSLPTTTEPLATFEGAQRPSVLLPALVLIKPQNDETFNASTVILEWSSIKKNVASNEYYIITIRFQHGGSVWTDYAFTQETNWSMEDHKYLLDLSADGRFTWSVQLIRATGKNEDGVPTGFAVSEQSQERSFSWTHPNRKPPQPEATRCSFYGGGCITFPLTTGQLLFAFGWMGFGGILGLVVLMTARSKSQEDNSNK